MICEGPSHTIKGTNSWNTFRGLALALSLPFLRCSSSSSFVSLPIFSSSVCPPFVSVGPEWNTCSDYWSGQSCLGTPSLQHFFGSFLLLVLSLNVCLFLCVFLFLYLCMFSVCARLLFLYFVLLSPFLIQSRKKAVC